MKSKEDVMNLMSQPEQTVYLLDRRTDDRPDQEEENRIGPASGLCCCRESGLFGQKVNNSGSLGL